MTLTTHYLFYGVQQAGPALCNLDLEKTGALPGSPHPTRYDSHDQGVRFVNFGITNCMALHSAHRYPFSVLSVPKWRVAGMITCLTMLAR